MFVMKAVGILGLAFSAGAMELTPDTWDSATAGKQVFVKFQAPWWGHCKKLKPDWDRLMDDFAGNPNAMVADVDCTTEGEALCQKFGVSGYPSIKYGDPSDMKDYSGGRSYEDLKQFADENLGPQCGPGEDLALCDEATRKKVEALVAMTVEKLEAKISKTVKDFEVELPIMKKVMPYVKKKEL
jgi:protein disulfide-isomerase-like protein